MKLYLFIFLFTRLFTRQDSPIVAALRECMDGIQPSWKSTGYPLIVIGTTSASGSLPVGLVSCFKQEILFEVSGYLQL
jgi:peroxin-6